MHTRFSIRATGVAAESGFTLVELLTTITIVAIVAAIAVPGMREFVQNNRAANDANAIVSAINVARNEAVTRGVRVSVCVANDTGTDCDDSNNWNNGWLVFADPNAPAGTIDAGGAVDDQILRVFPALETGAELSNAEGFPDLPEFVSVGSNGFLASGAAVTWALDVEDCTGDHNRNIALNLQARVAVSHEPCGDGY